MSLRGRPLFSALATGTGGGGSFAVDPVAVVVDDEIVLVVLEDEELDATVDDGELVAISQDDTMEASHNGDDDTMDAVPW